MSLAVMAAPLTCCSGGSSRKARPTSARLTIVPELPIATVNPQRVTSRRTSARNERTYRRHSASALFFTSPPTPKRSVRRMAPSLRLRAASTFASSPITNSVLPPPMSISR